MTSKKDIFVGSLYIFIFLQQLWGNPSQPLIKREFHFFNEAGKEVLHGAFVESIDERMLSQGKYDLGQKDGLWKHWRPKGQLWRVENWNKGLQDGEWKEWGSAGNLISRYGYALGVKEGKEEHWYHNGSIKSSFGWLNGELHGAYEQWHRDGTRQKQCIYLHGEIDGLSHEWNKQGDLVKEELFQEGQVRKILLYHEKYKNEHMKVSYSYYYDDNRQEVRHGNMSKWFPNGETWIKCQYVHGQLDGLWQYGKIDGLNCRQEHYKLGVKDGPCREFHLGEMIREEIWKDGVLVHESN